MYICNDGIFMQVHIIIHLERLFFRQSIGQNCPHNLYYIPSFSNKMFSEVPEKSIFSISLIIL